MNIQIGTPQYATIQMVGNKSNGDGIAFTSKAEDLSCAEDFIKQLIDNVFKFETLSEFDYIDSLEHNPTYRFVRAIFTNKDDFVKQSNNLARHLYDQSIHPNIKNGEFYVIYLRDCVFNDEHVNGLLLLKTEVKDKFLTVSNNNGEMSIVPNLGISTKHIDKGCLIFDTRNDGYILSIVDSTNIKTDGLYWTNNFLYAKQHITDFQLTENLAMFCSSAISHISKQNPTKAIDLAKASRNVSLILQNDGVTINTSDLLKILSTDDDISSQLSQFKHEYETSRGLIPKTFTCVSKASKRKGITKSNILKLGSDFELKILNSSALIEQGYDEEKGRSFIQLFYR